MTRQLRVAEPDEVLPQPKTIAEAARGPSRRELLVAMRDRVAEATDNPKTLPRDLGTLTHRLLEIVKEIEAIDAGDRGDDVGTAAATPDEEWAAT